MRICIGQQGEIRIFKISELPEIESKKVDRVKLGHIISHSEQGNHHVLTDGEVMERVNNVPEGMRILYALLEDDAELIQDATKPHEGYKLDAGIYEFRISREYDPFSEQARMVAD